MHRFVLAALIIGFGTMPLNALATSHIMCTMQYDPVCGVDAKGAYRTYGNSCTLGAEGGTFVHEGECTGDEGQVPEEPGETVVQPTAPSIPEATATVPMVESEPDQGFVMRLWSSIRSWLAFLF